MKLVAKDLESFGLTHDQVASSEMTKTALKKKLCEIARKSALSELLTKLRTKTKGKELKYNNLEMQDYLKSEKLSKKEKNTMTALRTECMKGIKSNFPRMHMVCPHCPLGCNSEAPPPDTQEHVLVCPNLGNASNIEMVFMHAGSEDQSKLAKEFNKRMTKRKQILEDPARDASACCHLPGGIPDHSDQ